MGETNLQVSAMEDTLVQDQSLRHQAWLRELHIRIPAYPGLAIRLLPGSADHIDSSRLLEVTRTRGTWNAPLGMAGELIQQDGDAIDGSAALEVRLNLLR